MFAGHFGVAGLVKAWRPALPMGVLLVASQLPDIVFLPLSAAGIEGLGPVEGASGYGSMLIDAPYSHALVSNVLLAVAAGVLVRLLARDRWGPGAGWITGAVVFSHWLLDLVVHRPDIAVLPGGWGDLPLLGLGLWEIPLLAAVFEGVLVAAGAALYAWRVVREHPDRTRAVLYAVGVALLLVGSFVWDLLSG